MLRRRAEDRLRARPAGPRVEATEAVLRLIHELEVHQIELELQNEELRRARDELEASVTRFSELRLRAGRLGQPFRRQMCR